MKRPEVRQRNAEAQKGRNILTKPNAKCLKHIREKP